jgi:hypothetical protein
MIDDDVLPPHLDIPNLGNSKKKKRKQLAYK